MGQMIGPMKELVLNLGQTEGVGRRLEEFTSGGRLEVLEETWRKMRERAESQVEVTGLEEWS